MLKIAGAEYGMCASGARSVVWEPQQLADYDADVIMVGPCGFDLARAVADTQALWFREDTAGWWRQLRAVRDGRVFAMDANSYCARPGPRLVQGTAIMAGILHGARMRERLGERLCPRDAWAPVPSPTSM